MGRAIDDTFIQSRMLNTGKGPAVHSLRAQADKQAYQPAHAPGGGRLRKPRSAAGGDSAAFEVENGRVAGVDDHHRRAGGLPRGGGLLPACI